MIVLNVLAGWGTVAAADPKTSPTMEPNKPETSNPHWQSDGCNICHISGPKGLLPTKINEIDSMCLACHNGHDAASEAHPIGRTLRSDSEFSRPENWPLVDGKLGCVTCHNIKLACDPAKKRPLSNREFLRDRWVGSKKKFCQNCHQARSFNKLIPHIMISGSRDLIHLGEQNKIDESACLFCHNELPDRTTRIRTGRPQLRSPQKILCQICHRMHKTFYDPGHMGALISSEMQVYMYARELLGGTVLPDHLLLERLARSGAKPTQMVPDSQGKITCTTCHNPHQENVFSSDSELSHNPMWLVGPQKMVSSSSSKETCIDCHN